MCLLDVLFRTPEQVPQEVGEDLCDGLVGRQWYHSSRVFRFFGFGAEVQFEPDLQVNKDEAKYSVGTYHSALTQSPSRASSRIPSRMASAPTARTFP